MKFRKLFPIIFIFILLGLFSLGYIYFFNVVPEYEEKPIVEKPASTTEIKLDHIIYLLNLIGTNKLHCNPFSGEPAEFIFIISDSEKEFNFRVEKGEIYLVEEADPDMRIIADEPILVEIINAETPTDELLERIDKGELYFEVIAHETELAFKGYKSIYDSLQKGNKLTGKVVEFNELKAETVTNGIGLSTLLFVVVLLGMILNVEI